MRSVVLLGLVVAVTVVQIGGAEHVRAEVVDGPKQIFRDSLIERLVGDWNLTRSIRGEQLQNVVHAEWILNHQFLQVHMKDVLVPPSYEALVLIGYEHGNRRYVAHWCDTFGGRFSAIGYGTRVGDSIEFKFAYPDGPFYNTFSWSSETKSWTFRMEAVDKAGKRVLFGEDKLTRKVRGRRSR